MNTLRRLLIALAWLAMAVVIALGSAGMASALNHVPATDTRPELTWAGDQQAGAALDAATAKLQTLSDAVDALGASSKDALVSLVAGDTNALVEALDKGTVQLATISTATADLRTALAAVPYTGPQAALHLSADVVARYQQLAATPALTVNLADDWTVLSARAMAASGVPALLALHDRQTAAAAKQGEASHYQQALALLDAPAATLAQARALRDQLAKTADVSTLSAWLDRQASYDAALHNLYAAMLASKGRVTADVRAAFAAEEAAKAALPANTKGIAVIMGDIARGGLNQAVIDIELARGALAAALAAQPQPPAPSAGASGSPAPSVAPAASTSPSGASASPGPSGASASPGPSGSTAAGRSPSPSGPAAPSVPAKGSTSPAAPSGGSVTPPP